MYRAFTEDGMNETEIMAALNKRGILTDLERLWTRSTVHQVLTNEKYIGNYLFNRVSFKLKKRRVCNPPDMWVRNEGAFEAVVDPLKHACRMARLKLALIPNPSRCAWRKSPL